MLSNKEYLSGTLSTIILALLKSNGRMYGYEICQKTKLLTKEAIQLTEGAIYPALHKLEKKKLIRSSKEKVNGRLRKYYEINKKSETEVSTSIESLFVFSKQIQLLLKPALK
jgi:DNA-binding PadR family transcriptional regulator